MMDSTRIERAPNEPPLWGRWKVYVDGKYIGSSPSKRQAQSMMRSMMRGTANFGPRKSKDAERPRVKTAQ
jgi:hypothetical protein